MSDIAAGKWKQIRGKIKEQWGQLTDDDIDRIDGKREQLVGKLQATYGKERADLEKEVDRFLASHS